MDADKKDIDHYGATAHVENLDGSSLTKADAAFAEYDDSIEGTEPSRAVWLITFTVATGGFLFGASQTILHDP